MPHQLLDPGFHEPPPVALRVGRRGVGLPCLIGLLGLACGAAPVADRGGPVAGWPSVGGDAGGTRHSPLTQITPDNVADLEVAWTYHTGEFADGKEGRPRGAFEATPILADGTLYLCSPTNRVIALDAESGAERWVHDPQVDRRSP